MCVLSPFSYVQLLASLWTVACQLLCPWNFPGKILECIVISFSGGFSQPSDQTLVYCLLHWQAGSVSLAPPGKPELCHIFGKLICTLPCDAWASRCRARARGLTDFSICSTQAQQFQLPGCRLQAW